MVRMWLRVWLTLAVLVGSVAAQQGPTTPVPPVPTDAELFDAYQIQLDQLNAQIKDAELTLFVNRHLLTRTPRGALYDQIQRAIWDLEAKVIQWKHQRSLVLAAMAELDP